MSTNSLRGRLAAHTRWAGLDAAGRKAATAAARRAAEDRWLRLAREQHPAASDAELTRIADSLKAAHFARMALRSAQARRRPSKTSPAQ